MKKAFMSTAATIDQSNLGADLGADLMAFATEIQACQTLGQISALFTAAVRPLGMTACASGMVSGPKSLTSNVFHFINWPPKWLAVYAAREFDRKDPAPRWAISSGLPVSWSEVLAKLPADDPGHEVGAAAAEFGFSDGFITPVRSADGWLGLVSVGGAPARLGESERTYLQTISAGAFHRAEALSIPPAKTAALFSRREQECISLLNQGFTDREIGQALGVAESTARFHIDNARRKVGARSRSQLVVLAATLQRQSTIT
jgi:DNA-binding CsgD family transcriptional regulator